MSKKQQPLTSCLGCSGCVVVLIIGSIIGLNWLADIDWPEPVPTARDVSPESSDTEPTITEITVVTKAEFEAITNGMTYEQVVSIIGQSGEQITYIDFEGDVAATYQWFNEDGTNMMVMLHNDKVTSKAQFGLK